MTAKQRLSLAGAVLALLILGAAGGGAFLLYDAAFQEQRRLLLNTVRSHGALIQAVARFDVQHSPDYPTPFPGIAQGGHAATLNQVSAAFAHAGGPHNLGELVLGARQNAGVVILLHQRPDAHDRSHPFKQHVVDKGRAEPMHRALNGETGTMVGKDYEGRTVLAAYRPLSEVGWGLVAKRELAAIRAPYIRAGLIAGALGLALVAIGGGLFHAATSPILSRLRRSESWWERLFQGAGEGIAATDLQGRIQRANPQARRLFGLTPDTPIEGRPLFDFLPPEAHDEFQKRLQERQEGVGEVYEITLDVAGTERILWFHATPLPGPDGAPEGSLTLIEDVTDQRRAEAEQRILSDAVHQIADAVFLMAPDGGIEYANPAFRRITGYCQDAIRGRRPEELLDAGRMPEGYYDRMWTTVTSGAVFRDVMLNRDRNGRLFHWEATLSPILGENGTLVRVVGTATDLSEREALQEQLHRASHTDALTELPNRLSLLEQLETLVARAQRSQRLTALALLDIDNFALINDSFGHDVGDQLLKALGERLTDTVREGDLVARTGGDGFGIILDQIARREDVPWLIDTIWSQLSHPFTVAGQEIPLTPAMGVALAPEDATEAKGLYHQADAALAQAKRSPQQTYRFYAEEMGQWARRRLAIEQGLRRALNEDGFELHFQPQIELSNGRLRGFETLIRWAHPDWGPVSPAEFIPVAEQSQLILPLGEWVLNRALEQRANWRAAGMDPGVISVNLSPVQLAEPDLPTKVGQALDRTGEAPEGLELEVTETALMTHVATAAAHLATLSEMGVRLAVDDFGTGYSSLAYLSQLPLDILKIDRSFVGQLDYQNGATSIILSVLSLAHSLGMKVVAEGVETEDQLAFLRHHGCDTVQGFLLSRPVPAAEVPTLLERGRWLEAPGQEPGAS